MTNPTPSPAEPVQFSVVLPDARALASGGAAALEMVEAFEVVDDATYVLAGEEMQACQRAAQKLTETRLSMTRPIDESKARVMDFFRGPISTLERAAELWKGKMAAHVQRVRAAAEAERLANERAAAAERARLAAEAAALREQGRAGEAEVKDRVAEMVVATAPARHEAPKIAGVSIRDSGFDVVVEDLDALIDFVAAHKEHRALLTFVQSKVRAHVVALGGVECKTPGLKITPKTSIAGSRK